jgi:hypothetical protein
MPDISLEYLDPWWATDGQDEAFHAQFLKQLTTEVGPGHPMYGVPAKLIARGNGDDCLFKLLDGTERVAIVHLTWSGRRETLPWPQTQVFKDLDQWRDEWMVPEHEEWLED